MENAPDTATSQLHLHLHPTPLWDGPESHIRHQARWPRRVRDCNRGPERAPGSGQPDRPSPAAGHRSSDQPRQAAGPPVPVRGAGLAWELHTGTAGPGQAGGHYLSDGVSEEQDAGPAQEPPADSRLRQRHGRGRTSAGRGGLAASSSARDGADRWQAPVTNRVQIPAPLNLLSPL